MAFKGTLPSELWDRYDCEGGQHRLNIDLLVAAEISEQTREATESAKKASPKRAKAAVARRNRRREEREGLSNTDILDTIRAAGMPIERVGFDDDSE